MSTKTSARDSCETNTLVTKSQSSATQQESQREALQRSLVLTLSNVSDLALFLPLPMTLPLELEQWKRSLLDKLMAVRRYSSTALGVLSSVGQCLEDTDTKKPKMVRSSRSRTKTTRKGSRT